MLTSNSRDFLFSRSICNSDSSANLSEAVQEDVDGEGMDIESGMEFDRVVISLTELAVKVSEVDVPPERGTDVDISRQLDNSCLGSIPTKCVNRCFPLCLQLVLGKTCRTSCDIDLAVMSGNLLTAIERTVANPTDSSAFS